MKINLKKILGNPILKGILKETVSYIPVVGDTLANKIENKALEGVTSVVPKSHQYQEILGKILVGGLLVSFVMGWITMEDVKSLIGMAE